MRILLLKPSSLGDVIHALPVLRLLRRRWPQGEIYWWIESGLAPLLEDDPDLTGIVRFKRRRWAAPRNWLTLWHSLQWIRRQAFDYVIDLQGLARSGAFAWLANGNLTIGLAEAREGALGAYDLVAPPPAPLPAPRAGWKLLDVPASSSSKPARATAASAPVPTHAVDACLNVLPLLGVPLERDFQWLPPRPAVAAVVRQKWPVAGGRWLLLQPGARWATKRWPVEHYAELARRVLARQPGLRCAILGGSEDRSLGQVIAQAAPERCLDLTGQLTLPEMVEWIRLGELMVTNDTGPMHVAAALGTPLVALFGPTDPRHTGPYGQFEQVLQLSLACVPCNKARCGWAKPFECLRALSPAVVCEAVCRRLAQLSFAACLPTADG